MSPSQGFATAFVAAVFLRTVTTAAVECPALPYDAEASSEPVPGLLLFDSISTTYLIYDDTEPWEQHNAFCAKHGISQVLHPNDLPIDQLVDKLTYGRLNANPWELAPSERQAWFTIKRLYEMYAADLIRVRAEVLEFRSSMPDDVEGTAPGQFGQKVALDDMEAELSYLRLRDTRPGRVLEMSPNCGYSSFWLLSALRDNGVGELHSFDLVDCSQRMFEAVPVATRLMAQVAWNLTVGDVKQTILTTERYDYLFIDSAHDAAFTAWYLQAIVQPHFEQSDNARPLHMQVHDVYGGWGDKSKPYDAEGNPTDVILMPSTEVSDTSLAHRTSLARRGTSACPGLVRPSQYSLTNKITVLNTQLGASNSTTSVPALLILNRVPWFYSGSPTA